MKTLCLVLVLALAATAVHAAPPEPKFRAVTIDDKIQIGYGLAIADVDGDGKPDILLADKKQFVWYRNPGAEKSGDPAAWTKYVIAENLTEHDNVCLAAEDIDGDGKCELAVGAEWNPGDTVNSGAVFYLIPPADRTQKWEPVKFPSVEPTTHRMKWVPLKVRDDATIKNWRYHWGLVVVPLHGRENKSGEGVPVKVLLYHPPSDPRSEWKSETIAESMHMTHNFDWNRVADGFVRGLSFLLVAGKEGVSYYMLSDGRVTPRSGTSLIPELGGEGVGEVRINAKDYRTPFLYSTIEPMHGNQLTVYLSVKKSGDEGGKENSPKLKRHLLTDKLTEGHALACDDMFGVGSDQIVVGWRGTPGKEGSTFGIHLWTPLDPEGKDWRDSAVDDGGMACEDLVLADLNGDGKLDIIASGRATHNVKIYFNETPR